jgi:hypothetical protein
MQQGQLERHRARRYLLRANIEAKDVQSETQISGRTSDLSLFGCHVNTLKPLTPGTKIRIKMTLGSVNFQALGRVVYARSNKGMGIVLTNIQPNDQRVLEKWTAQLRASEKDARLPAL